MTAPLKKNVSESVASESPSPEKNGVSDAVAAPETEPKKMGRPLGSPNKITAEIREMIMKRGKPVELLCDISRGVKIRVGAQAGPNKEEIYPDLAMRKDAAKTLLAKLVPDLRSQELTGDPDKPVVPPLSESEVARRLASYLYRADMPDKPARGGAVARDAGAGAEGLNPPPDAPALGAEALGGGAATRADAPAPGSPGGPDGVDGGSRAAAADAPVGAAGGEPEAIEPGQVARVGGYLVCCGEPQRPGLPPTHSILDANGIKINEGGDFASALAWCRRKAGDDAAPVEVVTPTLHRDADPSRPDQQESAAWSRPETHRRR